MMTRERKAQEIAVISEKFGRSKAAFLVDFKGMDVENVTKLRKSLRPAESEMKVVRNTLALRALADHPDMKAALENEFAGTNAIVFAYNEATAAAKALKEFGKEVEAFQIKSGAMDGQRLSDVAVNQLADLPSKDELRAMLLAVFAAPMTKFLGTVQAVPAGFARVLNAYKETKPS